MNKKTVKWVKFASLDGSLKGWAPASKFAAYGDIKQNLMDHEGHKDEVFAESGNELLISCPVGSTNITWRVVEAPVATPEAYPVEDKESSCGHCGSVEHKEAHCGMPHKAHEELSESDESQPGQDDIYIQYDRNGKAVASSPDHGVIATRAVGSRIEPLYEDIRDWMEANSWFPSVWFVSDHGNIHLDTDFLKWMNENQFKTSSLNKDAHIRHEDGKWVIYSHDYKKKLGTYDSKEEATKRLREIEYFKHQGSLQPLSKKEANVMETKCEECGEELGPEVFLSKHPVCGKCTKKRHQQVVNPRQKKADQDISLADQVQGFKDRMQAVNERLANPPVKQADLETTQDLSKVDVKDLSEGILHMIDMLEEKTKETESTDINPMLEELENKVWEVEMKLGIKPELPEHEKIETEHKEIMEEVEKESAFKTPKPTTPPPPGMNYVYDEDAGTWSLITGTTVPVPTGGSGY